MKGNISYFLLIMLISFGVFAKPEEKISSSITTKASLKKSISKRSMKNRKEKSFIFTLSPIGYEAGGTAKSITFGKYLNQDSILTFKMSRIIPKSSMNQPGESDVLNYRGEMFTVSYKKFIKELYYIRTSLYKRHMRYDVGNVEYILQTASSSNNVTKKSNHVDDFGFIIGFGSQYQWESLTLNFDYFGIGTAITGVFNGADANDQKLVVSLLNVGIGLSF